MRGITWDDSKPKPRRGFATGLVAAALVVTAAGPAAALAPTGPEVSVIVSRAAGSKAGVAEQSIRAAHGQVVRQLGLIDSITARVPESELARLASAPGIGEVLPDAPVQMLSTSYEPTTDFGSAYNAQLRSGVGDLHEQGLTGRGVTVALIDTGVVPVNGLRTAGKIIYGPDLSFESRAANLRNLDTYGHGTHMAGIIAGRDDAATAPYNNPAHFSGVAPEARVLSVKIGDARGATDVSTMIAAIDWVVTHRNDNGMNVRVMNLSFGTTSTHTYQYDPIAHAVENAWAKGIVVVTSAGNRGTSEWRLDNPARDPHVIAVGSVNYNVGSGTGKQLQVMGKCLGTKGASNSLGTNVVIADCNGTTNQKWKINADRTVTHVGSGGCLDVWGNRTANGTKVITYRCTGAINQKWAGSFAKTSELISEASRKCLDDPAFSTTPGTELQIYTCNPGANQRFTRPLSDDTASSFSQQGDGWRNVDVMAPGQSVAGLRAPGSFVDKTYTNAVTGTRFFRGSGTSQSAAFVSGLVALQLQRRPTAKPDDIKAELKRMTIKLAGVPDRIQGGGAVDVRNLRSLPTTAAPVQGYAKSAGNGSLQGSRGTMKLSMNNITLAGEKDIFGKAVNTGALAAARTTGSSWSGGIWNGSTWSGSTWSGSSWSGSSWSGSSWSGSSWSSQTYSANYWNGSSWSGSSWSGSTWSGSSWSGSTWSSNTLWGV